MIQLNLNQFTQLWRRAQVGDEPVAAPAAPEPRRIGLALGGGGGKASAHLGVLKVLSDLQLPIDLLAGTSAGGAVGILYAAGLSLEEIGQALRAMALRRIVTTDPTRTALIGSRRLEEMLRGLLGERSFADLPIPCAVVATDLLSGAEVIIDEGPLVPAILATTALPSILPPVVRGDQLLADGGILNNLPVDLARRMGAQHVIAVELSEADPGFTLSAADMGGPLRLSLGQPQLAIANRALGLMMARSTALHLANHPPSLLLRPDVAQIATLDMLSTERGWRMGEAAALAAIEQIAELRAWRLAPPEPPDPPRPARPRWSLPAWRWPELPGLPSAE